MIKYILGPVLFLAIFFLGISPGTARAESGNFTDQATADCYIKWSAQNNQYTTVDLMMQYDNADQRRTLIRFTPDWSEVPSGGSVANATVYFHYYTYSAHLPTGDTVNVYETSSPWSGYTTWLKYDGTNSWTNPGGDYIDDDTASSFVFPGSFGWIAVDITDIANHCLSENTSIGLIFIKPYVADATCIGTSYSIEDAGEEPYIYIEWETEDEEPEPETPGDTQGGEDLEMIYIILFLGVNGLTIFKKDVIYRAAACFVTFGTLLYFSSLDSNIFIIVSLVLVIAYQIRTIWMEKKK